ncbi:MAG: histidinol-phosphate transaminase [Lentisphaeria bacterium]|nr:histidinol-phosphate transaminase [Lentisphaeria bacterium]
MKSYFRPAIDALAGYTPGEQPKIENLVKLNTNENPYPPSPAVIAAVAGFAAEKLRRYPDPAADGLRDAVAARYGLKRENVICGNGSDDLLTMIFRAFTAPDRPVAVLDPSYSLYPVLAAMQEAPVIRMPLDPATFEPSGRLADLARGANLVMLTRPNAPTGNALGRAEVEAFCAGFDGIVAIDEAYADFADDNCMEFAAKFDNVLVLRTFSKSYSLAGVRLGYAVGHPVLIDGLMKLKDSYNVDMLTQAIGCAAFADEATLNAHVTAIRATRARLAKELGKLGFTVVPSQSNFLFAAPPDGDGARAFGELRRAAVIVRYFPGEVTGRFIRVSIGTDAEIDRLLEVLRGVYR